VDVRSFFHFHSAPPPFLPSIDHSGSVADLRRRFYQTGAGIPLTSAQLYSGCYLDDIRSTLLYLREEYPEAPLLGIGFSLGANVLLRYVEEEGDQCRLRSATVLGCVSDLYSRDMVFLMN